ncbi:hypothetical protein DL768_006348 [Monosporascus sp. mg162]|nr:hypothetical protein DL768_006348 [Monosporascus sp. mg162]
MYYGGAGNSRVRISGMPGGATPATAAYGGVEALAGAATREGRTQVPQARHGAALATHRARAKQACRRFKENRQLRRGGYSVGGTTGRRARRRGRLGLELGLGGACGSVGGGSGGASTNGSYALSERRYLLSLTLATLYRAIQK